MVTKVFLKCPASILGSKVQGDVVFSDNTSPEKTKNKTIFGFCHSSFLSLAATSFYEYLTEIKFGFNFLSEIYKIKINSCILIIEICFEQPWHYDSGNDLDKNILSNSFIAL